MTVLAQANNPPELEPIGDQNVDEGDTLTFTATATDPDDPPQTLTFSLEAGAPAGATIDPNTGEFSWTAPAEVGVANTFSVTVTVTDDDAVDPLSASETITITVNEVNAEPTLDPIGDQSVSEGATLTFTANGTDTDDPAQTLTFSLDAGAPAAAMIDPNTGEFNWTPNEDDGPGMFPVTVTVTDDGTPPLSASETITITVNEVNAEPTLDPIGDQSVDEGATLTFTANATDLDDPPQTLTFSLDAGAPAAATIDPVTGEFSWTAPAEVGAVNTFPVTITVTDDDAIDPLSASETITITVDEVNAAPELDPIGDQTVDEGDTLTFTATASDSDDPAQTLTFSLDAGAPAGATIDPVTGEFSWATTPADGPNTYPVTVRVTDDGTPALDASETITITVTDVNLAPVLDPIGDQTVDEGDTLTFTATATDDPTQTLTFSLDAGAPAGATIDPSTGEFSWTAPAEVGAANTFPVIITVTDDDAVDPLSASETITITVAEVNAAPTLDPIDDKSVNEGDTLTFTATASDSDDPAQTLTFSLDAGAPAGATIDPVTGEFSWTTVEADGPNTYPVTVRVTDNGTPTLDAFEIIVITVNEVNNAPVLDPIGDQSVDERTTLNFTATAVDTDTPPQTLIYFLGAGAPAGATMNPTTGEFAWTPTEAQGGAEYEVTVFVLNLGTPVLLDSETITITVNKTNTAPVLDPVGNKETLEGDTLTFTVTASDSDIPAQTLTFSLDAGAPAGATINPTTGEFFWEPGEVINPNFAITIRVTDNGTPALSDSETINVFVGGANVAPVLEPIGPQTVDEGATLTFDANATDDDLPAQTLTYTLEPGAPAGASIVSTTGVFTWTPGEVDLTNVFTVTVKVTDNGNPALSDTETVTITVNEVNAAPVIDAIGPKQGTVGTAISFDVNATDSDLPANTLTYSLEAGAPAGATIDPTTGVFNWTPDAAGSFNVTVVVTDNGTPALTDSETVTIQVEESSILENAGFETAGATEKDAAGWNEFQTKAKDRRVCDSAELGDISPEGNCAWQFKRGVRIPRRIQRKLPLAGLTAGTTLEISGLAKTDKLNGNARVQIKAVYTTGTPTKTNIILTKSASTDYQPFSDTLTLNGTPTKVVVKIETRGSTGTFYVDALVVRKQSAGLPEGDTLPMPAPPTDMRGSN